MEEAVIKRRRITPETRRLIASLLKQGLTASEVVAALWGDGLTISITPVTQEAYKLGIKLRSGPRKGMPGIGRPPLLVVRKDTPMLHPEHENKIIPAGTYLVRRQREQFQEEARYVQD